MSQSILFDQLICHATPASTMNRILESEKHEGGSSTIEISFRPLESILSFIMCSCKFFRLLYQLIAKMAFLVGRDVGAKSNWKIEKG